MGRISADEFLATVAPALDAGDTDALCESVCQRWSTQDLCCLLKHADPDVRRTAVVVLGMVGDRSILGCLTRCLHDDDEQVRQFAEDALWSIWFRSGKPEAARHFHRGTQCLAEDKFDDAIGAFVAATEADPSFAEAYNQLAIVHYLGHEWKACASACRQALALMPTHFGALAGLGHVHAHRGELRQAVDCYRRALAINPNMSAIAEAKADLESQLDDVESPNAIPLSTQVLHFGRDRFAE